MAWATWAACARCAAATARVAVKWRLFCRGSPQAHQRSAAPSRRAGRRPSRRMPQTGQTCTAQSGGQNLKARQGGGLQSGGTVRQACPPRLRCLPSHTHAAPFRHPLPCAHGKPCPSLAPSPLPPSPLPPSHVALVVLTQPHGHPSIQQHQLGAAPTVQPGGGVKTHGLGRPPRRRHQPVERLAKGEVERDCRGGGD